ncbi:MAG: methylated-DNA--[protein]-cysteine S-methyltransferase [Planctomycetota bacterium]|nr:MAG: methylated-DNA--[protein]-cysteine S-methyltransferase [Planctomycetota bacterium]
MASDSHLNLAAFPTDLGWAALATKDSFVEQIAFAYPSAAAALAAVDVDVACGEDAGKDWRWLIDRLQDFSTGQPVDFSDVPLAIEHLTAFRRRVIEHARAIPYGATRSYGELAALAGSPRAARAVGSTMATNRFSIVVPCHRVTNSDGTPGAYGGPNGAALKRRLLDMEQRAVATFGRPRRIAKRGRKKPPPR